MKKGVEIKINLSNKVIYTLIVIGILMIVGTGVYALASGVDVTDGYHESDQISVDVSGNEKTLQEAIDNGDFGGEWSVSGSNIYYNGGNVGIGISSPSATLDVIGGIKTSSSAVTYGSACSSSQWGEFRRCDNGAGNYQNVCACIKYSGSWVWRFLGN